MSLSTKYNIPKETIQKMINDGVISCSWPMYEEIYEMYKKKMSIGGKSKTQICIEISEERNVSQRTVHYIVNKF